MDTAATIAGVSTTAGERKINICQINEMITCKICSGYLIDATTVTECLHTFCKSCIVKHLEDQINCPECEVMIHQSHPLDYIAFDRTMQDIVYKLVPGLEESEYKREREFYTERGLPCPKDQEMESEGEQEQHQEEEQEHQEFNSQGDFHRFDEQVHLVLESASPTVLPQLKRQFIRVSSMATITHLKKFLAHKVLPMKEKLEEKKREERRKKKEEERQKEKDKEKDKDDDKDKDKVKEKEKEKGMEDEEEKEEEKDEEMSQLSEQFRDIDITCDGELIPKDHTLKFVYITRWRTKDPPLHLVYSPKINIESEVDGAGEVPEWKLQPKLSYDDDDDN